LTFATVIFATGCASNPLFKEWDWSIRPDPKAYQADQEARRKKINERLEKILQEHPDWRNARTNEEFSVDYYDVNGKRTGSAIIR
jgi:hypothetical protein